MKRFFILVRSPQVVATALTLINQGDRLITGMAPNSIKMLLTYLIPYCVSTHGAVTAMRDRSRGKRKRQKGAACPFGQAAQWRSRGNGTTGIRQGGVPDRVAIAAECGQWEIIGGNRGSGYPALDRRRLGKQTTEYSNVWGTQKNAGKVNPAKIKAQRPAKPSASVSASRGASAANSRAFRNMAILDLRWVYLVLFV